MNYFVILVVQSKALAYERGKVLCSYISALSEYKNFVEKHEHDNICGEFNFASTLCELIALRRHDFTDAYDRFASLRKLAITEVSNSFEEATKPNFTAPTATSLVTITVPPVDNSNQNNGATTAVISSNLLHASIILISNWQRKDSEEGEAQNSSEESSIMHLLRFLIIPFTSNGSSKVEENTVSGLSSAKHKHNMQPAVSVEEVRCAIIF